MPRTSQPRQCPECGAGKCQNCTRQVLVTIEDSDQWALCACPTCGGGLPWRGVDR